MKSSNQAVSYHTTTGKIISILGYFLLILSGLLLLVYIGSNDMNSFGYFLFLIIILMFSILSIIFGAKTKRQVKRFNKYAALIAGEQTTSIRSIANNTSLPVDFVKKDLQIMIYKGFFPNASLNLKTEEIVFGSKNTTPVTAPTGEIEEKEMRCPNCGANSIKQKGSIEYCEYCGSRIE